MFRKTVFAFLITGTCLAGQDKPAAEDDPVVATVNGESIKLSEVDRALNADLPAVTLTSAQRQELRAAIVEDLIDERLLRQFLTKGGARVDPAELDAMMANLKARLIHDNRTLEDYLKAAGLTEAQLREQWSIQVLLTNHVKRLASDARLREFHSANRDQFDKVQVRLSHIIIRTGKKATPVEKAAAREKLEAIRAEVVQGKSTFAAAARKSSQCPSALKGGDLGFILRRGSVEEEIARPAFALKLNEVSAVIESDRGMHLLMVTERKAGVPSKLENCLIEVFEAFAESVRAELLARLRKEGRIAVTLPR